MFMEREADVIPERASTGDIRSQNVQQPARLKCTEAWSYDSAHTAEEEPAVVVCCLGSWQFIIVV